jgi:streptomycin 6-kinase
VLRPAPRDVSDTISLDDWFDGLGRYKESSFPKAYAQKALDIYSELSQQREKIFYLHGDYHPGNVVNGTREPYLVIDAKGIIGHIGYEIAVFLNNLHWWQAEQSDIKEQLAVAVSKFSKGFGIEEKELRQWAFAGSVLGHWWTFDEMRNIYSGGVVKSDIWDV